MRQREDWFAQGVRALREGGVEAVRVEPLARSLGVTKGSFYWHFADRPALLEALLALWERETAEVVTEAARAATPAQRLVSAINGVGRNLAVVVDQACQENKFTA